MGPIPLDISSTHPLCLYQKIEFKTSSCKRDLSSQKIEIWRTLDHMLGNTIFHSSSMLYRIHQLPQANWENVFEGRCIHPWTKNNHRSPCYNHQSLDWQQFCLVSVSSVHICISSNRTTSRSNRFFFSSFGFTILSILPYKCSCCSMLNPMNIKVKIFEFGNVIYPRQSPFRNARQFYSSMWT